MTTGSIVELDGITKRWGGFIGLNDISLNVRRGEILTLLGPSGCGKSTLMRIIAGFETPTTGTLKINGKEMNRVPPERRPVNMVFQKYALFPHLDVFDNVSFSLRLKRVPEDEVRKRVQAMLELVQLDNFKNRWISEISGGQAQRVALARALIGKPEVLLLDEPLAALDLKIRHHMLGELKRIHEETGTTFIYVTHDQDEAMILSDRVILMNHGVIEQMGTPSEMYDEPKTLFCAKFFGDTNLFDGTIGAVKGDRITVDTPLGQIVEPAMPGVRTGDAVHVSVRPEAVLQTASGDPGVLPNRFDGQVVDATFIGGRTVYSVQLDGGMPVKCQNQRALHGHTFEQGERVTVSWSPGAARILLK